MTNIKTIILEFVKANKLCSSKQIFEYIKANLNLSLPTVKRALAELINENLLQTTGKSKSTKYHISPAYQVLMPIDIDLYYQSEIDERNIIEHFNLNIITDTLSIINIFTAAELEKLNILQTRYQQNIATLPKTTYTKELERLAIDLSWKSSQIEGNTYTLLETEILLKEQKTASGRTKDEATMLLNHKYAIDFLVANTDYLTPLSILKIEDIHSILIKDLDIERNIRTRSVGITGTNYRPIDNQFQIQDAMRAMCQLINTKTNIFEKSLLTLILISYIQPFADGNKRTARIVSNAILMHYQYCPISFRTVDSIDYKKAILLFYEQNNISKFKEIFISQFEFAVKTYFR